MSTKKAARRISKPPNHAKEILSTSGMLDTESGASRSSATSAFAATIGSQIRQLRRGRDLTVVELAAQAEMSIGMLSKIESSRVSASVDSLAALAHALNVPMATLFANCDEP